MAGEAAMSETVSPNPPAPAATPKPVRGHHDGPMWESIRQHRFSLQRCGSCGTFRYPPGPLCAECLSEEAEWVPAQGGGEILSWVIFHRQYLPAYPAPYNVIAVRLDEGPIMMSNLEGETPEGSWIGRRVRLVHATMPDGAVLPRFVLAP
jgi:uncharacterized OB-fold protein